MARLENRPARGLPPAPAPTRRSANPWKLSSTARKSEAGPGPAPGPQSLQEVLEGIVVADEPKHTERPHLEESRKRHNPIQPPKERRSSGIWPLLILLIAIGIVVKVLTDGFEGRDWRQLVAPLIAIAFIAHGWWRLRQRSRQRSGQGEDDQD